MGNAMKAKIPIIVDTDLGGDIDDALALGMALGSPELDLRAVTTVHGDTIRRALLAARLLRTFGCGTVPVAAGLGQPLKEPYVPDLIEAQFLAVKGDEPAPPLVSDAAIDVIRRLVEEAPGEIVLVAIGALTNVAALVERFPEAAAMLREMVIMGAAFEDDEAEWNIKCDPEAAKIVLESGLPMRIMPFERTRHAVMPTEQLERLYRESRPAHYLLARLTHLWQGGYGFGCNPCLHDPLALGCLTNPTLYSFEPKAIEVIVEPGARRGVTVGHRDASSRALVCTEVDYGEFFKTFEERLFSERPGPGVN